MIFLLGLTGAAVGSAMLNQQRFHGEASALLVARQGIRDAMEVLSADIRGSSPADTIRFMADSAVELFTTIGTSVTCRTITGSAVHLAAHSANGSTLTSFLFTPDTGDLALLYRTTGDTTVGIWERHRLWSFAVRSNHAGCLADGAAAPEGFALTLARLPDPPVRAGTPVRFIRRGRYSLYRASDGGWYLGYRRCNAVGPSACGAIQPLSGPYRPYSSDKTETGFLFEYFDAEGARLSAGDSPLSVARIDVTARPDESRAIPGTGTERPLPESATAVIAFRN